MKNVYQSSGFSALGSGINFGSSSSQPSGLTTLKSSIWAGSLSSLQRQYFVPSINYSKSLKMRMLQNSYDTKSHFLPSLGLLLPPSLIYPNLLLTCHFLVYIPWCVPCIHTHLYTFSFFFLF